MKQIRKIYYGIDFGDDYILQRSFEGGKEVSFNNIAEPKLPDYLSEERGIPVAIFKIKRHLATENY